MMKLPRQRRIGSESVVPMINVAFLLLVFFLMTATFVPPAPSHVVPPDADGERADLQQEVLLISSDGRLMLGEATGEAVFAAVRGPVLRVRADARLEAARLAEVVARLSRVGVTTIEVVTTPR